MSLNQRLREHAHHIAARAALAASPEFERPVRRLRLAALRVGQAWSGAWVPGLANLYTEALEPLAVAMGPGPACRVVAWSHAAIRKAIRHAAGDPDWLPLRDHATRVREWLDLARNETRRLLTEALEVFADDPVLIQLGAELEHIGPDEPERLLQAWRPLTRQPLRDRLHAGQAAVVAAAGAAAPAVSVASFVSFASVGPQAVPPHLQELAAVEAVRSPLTALYLLASLARRLAGRHDELQEREAVRDFEVTLPLLHRYGHCAVADARAARAAQAPRALML